MTDGFMIKDGILEGYTLRDLVVRVPDTVTVIGKGAFKGCASIEEVILPETITSIMDDAFKGCRKLTKINFPSKLAYIGEYAFHRCHSLQRVILPEVVTSLSHCVFLYCDSLEVISIPGVTRLGRQVFLNDVNLEKIEISKDLDVSCICDVFTGCGKVSQISLSDGTTFHIENMVDVLSSHSDMHPLVKAIAVDIYRMMEIRDGILYKFLTNLKYLEVPDGITAIYKSCFFDKKGLVSVKLPETLTDIGSRAFRNCINLERIEFANENVNISQDAFKNCTTLKYVTLPDRSIYELKGLPDTSDTKVPQIVRIIHSQILGNFLISGTTLVQYRGAEERVVVPEGITVIGERAFAGNEIVDRVILPDSIREIREEAFADCLLMQTIYMGEGLTYLGKSAFENCVKLIRMSLPESLTKIEESVFKRCKKLNEVQLGSSVEEIDSFAFYGCLSLKNLRLPEKLISIGDMAFYKCISLKEITLPKSLCKLGSNVFTASGMKSATIQSDLRECGTDIFSQCDKLRKLTFLEGVRSIGDKFAFRCPSLQYVNLPSTILYIGRSAFQDSIYINEMIERSEVTHIFMGGSQLSGEIVIPDGVTAIAGGAFYGNGDITSVTLPESLKRIGARAFCGCTSIKSITLPPGVTALEEGVFSYCTSLENVDSEGKIMDICDSAFYGCSSIKEVPSKDAVHVGKNAFGGCENLHDIKISCSDIEADAFRNTVFLDNMRNGSPLVILSNTVVDGKYCTGDIVIPEGVVRIAPYAFAGNEKIKGIVLPNSLETIGEGAFFGCKNVKEIVLSPSVKYIGKKAFEKCIALSHVSGHAQEIGEGAFSYCISLKAAALYGAVHFGKEIFCGCSSLEECKCEELQYIGDSCFSGCESLQAFDFSSIRSIGVSSFLGCSSLKSIQLNVDTAIAAHAFEDCSGIEEIILSQEGQKRCPPMGQETLHSFITELGVAAAQVVHSFSMKPEPQYGSYAFSGCTALKVIGIGDKRYTTPGYSVIFDKQIPDMVKSIYISAISCFDIDENLSLVGYHNRGVGVHIPDGIKRVEREVFKDVMMLENVYIPESVEYIGERAFHGTLWLEKQRAVSSMVIINKMLIDGAVCQGEVVIPDDVKIVSGWTFANCYALKGVTFSSPRTVAEEYAFRNCINLEKVTDASGKEYRLTGIWDRNDEMLPPRVKQIFMDCLNCFKTDENSILVECTGNIPNLILADGITEICQNVFKDSNLLTHITLSKDTAIIGESAFAHCKWLVSVKNACHVKRIEKLAFSGCLVLESIELSDKLQYIGARAFEHCTSLKAIVIPEGITEIPEKAFFRCHSLREVILPSTLKTIGREAFAFCTELTKIHFPQGLERVEEGAFAWCSKLEPDYMAGRMASNEAKRNDQPGYMQVKADPSTGDSQ